MHRAQVIEGAGDVRMRRAPRPAPDFDCLAVEGLRPLVIAQPFGHGAKIVGAFRDVRVVAEHPAQSESLAEVLISRGKVASFERVLTKLVKFGSP